MGTQSISRVHTGKSSLRMETFGFDFAEDAVSCVHLLPPAAVHYHYHGCCLCRCRPLPPPPSPLPYRLSACFPFAVETPHYITRTVPSDLKDVTSLRLSLQAAVALGEDSKLLGERVSSLDNMRQLAIIRRKIRDSSLLV